MRLKKVRTGWPFLPVLILFMEICSKTFVKSGTSVLMFFLFAVNFLVRAMTSSSEGSGLEDDNWSPQRDPQLEVDKKKQNTPNQNMRQSLDTKFINHSKQIIRKNVFSLLNH